MYEPKGKESILYRVIALESCRPTRVLGENKVVNEEIILWPNTSETREYDEAGGR